MSLKSFTGDILGWYLTFGVFLLLLGGTVVLVRNVVVAGVFPVAMAALATAVVLILLGARRLEPLRYVGIPFAWLAMVVVFVERLTAFGLSGWFAVGVWAFANAVAALVYVAVEEQPSGLTTAQRSLLYVGLFLTWPATAILFVALGTRLGLGDWTIVGGWLMASGLALIGYGRARDRALQVCGVLVGWLGLTAVVIDRGTAIGLNGWAVVGGWLLANVVVAGIAGIVIGEEADASPAAGDSVPAEPRSGSEIANTVARAATVPRLPEPYSVGPAARPSHMPASGASGGGAPRATATPRPTSSDAGDDGTDDWLRGLGLYALIGGAAALVFGARGLATVLLAGACGLFLVDVAWRATERFATRLVGVAVAAVAVGGVAVALVTDRVPNLASGSFVGLVGVTAVGLAVLGALVTLPHRPVLKPLVLACHGVMVVGAVAFAYPPARLIAALVIAIGLAGFLLTSGLLLRAAALEQHGDPAGEGNRSAPVVALLAVIAVSVPLTGLAVTSLFMRGGTEVRHYGTIAEVRVPSTCTSVTRIGRGGISQSPTITCEGASWSAEGRPVRGTLRATREELGAGMFITVGRVQAYVYGDRAYTEGASSPAASPIVALVEIPPALALSLLAAVAALVMLARRPDWRPPAPARDPGASTK